MKTLTDFTGMLHTRHPKEIGGCYWLINMLYTQISVIVVLGIRVQSDGVRGEGNWAIQQSDLRILSSLLMGMWILSILLLFAYSEKGYRRTFYQLTRSWEYNRFVFDTREDENRMSIFKDHKSYYKWYEIEVKDWLEALAARRMNETVRTKQ